MGPKTPVAQSSELFRQPCCEMLNSKNPLVKLADVIDWEEIERRFGAHFQTTATTLKEDIVVGMRSMPGNPWDGHTLEETLEQVGILNDRQPKVVIVGKGYQGVEVPNTQILRSGQRRCVTRTLRKMIKRRSAIEPTIGHMKMDGRLGRNPLKGALGDALHAVLCGAGHNIRLLLKKLRLLFAQIWQQLMAALLVQNSSLQAA